VGRLLTPNGRVIVTTPNRDAYDADVVWETDPPPVHLSWFSEEGIRRLASRAGLTASFVDFSEYSATRREYRHAVTAGTVTRDALLDAQGKPRAAPWRPSLRQRILQHATFAGPLIDVVQRRRGRERIHGARRDTMVAQLVRAN
jgi:hypothetical protein